MAFLCPQIKITGKTERLEVDDTLGAGIIWNCSCMWVNYAGYNVHTLVSCLAFLSSWGSWLWKRGCPLPPFQTPARLSHSMWHTASSQPPCLWRGRTGCDCILAEVVSRITNTWLLRNYLFFFFFFLNWLYLAILPSGRFISHVQDGGF